MFLYFESGLRCLIYRIMTTLLMRSGTGLFSRAGQRAGGVGEVSSVQTPNQLPDLQTFTLRSSERDSEWPARTRACTE